MKNFNVMNEKENILESVIEKLHQLYHTNTSFSQIEKDILLQSLREAYMAVLAMQTDEYAGKEESKKQEEEKPLLFSEEKMTDCNLPQDEEVQNEEDEKQKAENKMEIKEETVEIDKVNKTVEMDKVWEVEEKSKQLPLITSKRSLNDLFTEKREERSLNAKFSNEKIADLTKSISINDKFLFIRELFSNKGEEFSRSLHILNSCEDIESTFEKMEEMKKTYYWDSTSSAYLKLCDLIRRKF